MTFNVDDPDQKAMLDQVRKRKNKSAYIKRCVFLDMLREQGMGFSPAAEQVSAAPDEEELDVDAINAML